MLQQSTTTNKWKRLTYIILVTIILGIATTLIIITNGSEDVSQEELPTSTEESRPNKEGNTEQEEPVEDTEANELPEGVTVETESSTISISLKLYTIPNKNQVDIEIKNTSKNKATYKFSTPEIYKYKIIDEGNTVVKEGSFGKLEEKSETLTLQGNEEKKTAFNYDSIIKELKQGYYKLEVTVNNKDLSGSKASTTFTVNDFDTTATTIRTETLVIHSIDYEKNTLQGVVNGVSLVTFKFAQNLEPNLRKYKVGQDVLRATYHQEAGVFTLQSVIEDSASNKLPETPTSTSTTTSPNSEETKPNQDTKSPPK